MRIGIKNSIGYMESMNETRTSAQRYVDILKEPGQFIFFPAGPRAIRGTGSVRGSGRR